MAPRWPPGGAQHRVIARTDPGEPRCRDSRELLGQVATVGRGCGQVEARPAGQFPACTVPDSPRGGPPWPSYPLQVEGRGGQGATVLWARRGERECFLPPRGRPGVRAGGAARPGEEEQLPAPGRRWRPHPCVQAAGWGLAAGLWPNTDTTVLPSLCLGCPFSQHSDLRPAACPTPPTSSDPLPGSPGLPGSSSRARLGVPGSTGVSWLWLSWHPPLPTLFHHPQCVPVPGLE